MRIETEIDPANFRSVMGRYPTGVCVISGLQSNGAPTGMVVGSFTSVSLAPPLVAFLPGKASSSWSQMKASGQFCVNVLASDQIELCQAFSRKGEGKFEGVRYSLSDRGLPVLDDVIAYVECSTENEIDAGDHTIVIGLVKTLRPLRDAPALIFYRGGYREVAAHNL
ncbi:flavin reductase family protein [Sphingobium sp. BS19]|uniref:flavin reductase family protein n=1 Tax=Sphingobium sp. BS19 TaxID=3018973 RepID=UPI002493126B|nr:flavin reductase family protein [Sphingobium sp. BS19]